jgi:hypothetical protein
VTSAQLRQVLVNPSLRLADRVERRRRHAVGGEDAPDHLGPLADHTARVLEFGDEAMQQRGIDSTEVWRERTRPRRHISHV